MGPPTAALGNAAFAMQKNMVQASPAWHEDYCRAGVPDRGRGSHFGCGVQGFRCLVSCSSNQTFAVFTAGVWGAPGFLVGDLVSDRDECLKPSILKSHTANPKPCRTYIIGIRCEDVGVANALAGSVMGCNPAH